MAFLLPGHEICPKRLHSLVVVILQQPKIFIAKSILYCRNSPCNSAVARKPNRELFIMIKQGMILALLCRTPCSASCCRKQEICKMLCLSESSQQLLPAKLPWNRGQEIKDVPLLMESSVEALPALLSSSPPEVQKTLLGHKNII